MFIPRRERTSIDHAEMCERIAQPLELIWQVCALWQCLVDLAEQFAQRPVAIAYDLRDLSHMVGAAVVIIIECDHAVEQLAQFGNWRLNTIL